MRKLVSLIIVFLFMFNLLPSVFAVQTGTVDVNSFDEFSLEQVQKTFSNTLSQNTKTDTQNSNDKNFHLNDFVYNVQDISYVEQNLSLNVFFGDNGNSVLNYLYQYKLFEKNNLLNGITEYKIHFNSYMATALIDIYDAVFYI